MDRDQLVAYIDDLLDADEISDLSLNGLQVAGRSEVRRLATGVSMCAELVRQATDWQADALLVHHGLLWKGETQRVVGSYRERLRLLIESDMSLLAYHLPLDRHVGHGNAAVMARELGLERLESFGYFDGVAIGFAGVFPTPLPIDEVLARVEAVCGREPQLFPGGPDLVASVGIVSGGAPSAFEEAVTAGLDAYITGEAREWVPYRAIEEGVHYIAAGHYATERFGVRSLGEFLAKRFEIEVCFFDLDNPV
jgi:dinuclear metal center YbgI/SA1388 family protein